MLSLFGLFLAGIALSCASHAATGLFLWDICAESPLLSHKIALVCGISSLYSPSIRGACSAGHVFYTRSSAKFGKKRNPRTRNRSSTTENGRKNASRVKNTQKNLVVQKITRIFAV